MRDGLIAMMLVLGASQWSCNPSPNSEPDLAEFLGPLPGVTLSYVEEGNAEAGVPDVVTEVVGRRRVDARAIEVEMRKVGLEGRPLVYELAAGRDQLVSRIGNDEIVLLRRPLKKDARHWQVTGNVARPGETAEPWDLDCGVSWVGDLEVLEELRAAVSVTCVNDAGKVVTEITHTYAAGVGLVRTAWLLRSPSGEPMHQSDMELREAAGPSAD